MNVEPAPVEIVVDAANVVGSRPDGWWRDRAAAATRLVQALAVLPGRVLPAPAGVVVPPPAPGGLGAGPLGAGPGADPGAGPGAEPVELGDPAEGGESAVPREQHKQRGQSEQVERVESGQSIEPSGGLQVDRVLAVVEGQARQIPQVSGVSLVRSTADGDSAVGMPSDVACATRSNNPSRSRQSPPVSTRIGYGRPKAAT